MPMFNRFTERARKVILLAKEEAKKKSRVAAGKDKSPKNPYKPHAPKEDALMRGALLNHLMGGK